MDPAGGTLGAARYAARAGDDMRRSAQIERAITVWGLDKDEHRYVRWLPPESFLPEHAALVPQIMPLRRDAAAEEPDFVREHPEFFARRPPLRVRLPPISHEEVVSLGKIGTPEGPSVEKAVLVLRRVRLTDAELHAAFEVLSAKGLVPEAVRIECAYLFAVNELPRRALEVLDGVKSPHPFGSPLAPKETAGAILRDVEVLSKLTKIHHAPDPAPARRVPSTGDDRAVQPQVQDEDLARLARFGLHGGLGEEEVLAILRLARGSADGLRALRELQAARRNGPLPEAVRVLAAEMLAEYGRHEEAMALLDDVPRPPPPEPEPPGIDVDTPVAEREAEARANEAERVLAQDMNRLGVRERHTRWSAVARAAALTVEAFRALGGRSKRDALREAGRKLEAAGDAARAAEMYALGGDHAEAARAGVGPKKAPPRGGEAASMLAQLEALDRRGLRLAAVDAARAYLVEHPDADVAAFARGVIARLVRGPEITLAVDGREVRALLSETVTVGRAGAAIALATPLVSRVHLRVERRGGDVVVEDAGSHNGTWLAGARLSAPLPVGEGIDLAIAQQIPCSIRAAGDETKGAVTIDIAGERRLASLGPLALRGLVLERVPRGDGAVVTLCPAHGVRVTLGAEPIETTIELSRGDVVRIAGATPWQLAVIG
jgi:hypothetical protein